MDTAFNFNDSSDMESGWDFLMYLKKNNITFEVIEWEGSGGGWPVIEYSGTKESLELMLKEKFECDDADVKFHMEQE